MLSTAGAAAAAGGDDGPGAAIGFGTEAGWSLLLMLKVAVCSADIGFMAFLILAEHQIQMHEMLPCVTRSKARLIGGYDGVPKAVKVGALLDVWPIMGGYGGM